MPPGGVNKDKLGASAKADRAGGPRPEPVPVSAKGAHPLRKRRLGGENRRRLRASLLAKQGPHCCYCADAFDDSNPWGEKYPTIEHIENRARGGVNAQTNLAMACRRCNERAAIEDWSVGFKRAKISAANVIALADLEVEPMELPPLYIAQVRGAVA